MQDCICRIGYEGSYDGSGTWCEDVNECMPPLKVLQIAASPNQQKACALLKPGVVKCWGEGADGTLGQGDIEDLGDEPGEMGGALPVIDLGIGRTAVSISISRDTACALLDDGSAKCWGSNGNGQLGLGNTVDRGDNPDEMGDALPAIALGAGRTAKVVHAGAQHSCAVLDNGSVKCWGTNRDGELGQGDTMDRGGGDPDEMGDNLPPIDLGTGRTAVSISVMYPTCALLDDGSVKCWGYNGDGELGQGDTILRGDSASRMGNQLPAISLGAGRTAARISVGPQHVCALLDNGSVKCWGYNGDGQLGQGHTDNIGDQTGQMGDALPAIDLGTGRTAVSICAGEYNSCAVLDDGSVKCWGSNWAGQLGQGDTEDLGDDAGEMGDALPAIDLGANHSAVSVVCGGSFSCALLDEGQAVKCWGANDYGELGTGDLVYLGDDPGEVGDALAPVELVGESTVCEVRPRDEGKSWPSLSGLLLHVVEGVRDAFRACLTRLGSHWGVPCSRAGLA